MILIIQGSKVVGTATDAYTGPEQFITAPADFDITRMADYVFANGVVTVTSSGLDWTKAQQVALLTAACAAAITAGFQSSALGSAYTYPSQMTDQANLSANVLSSLLPGLPANWTTPQLCQDLSGVWSYINHTAAQIQQVGTDGKAAILSALVKKNGLVEQVSVASTAAAVAAIVW